MLYLTPRARSILKKPLGRLVGSQQALQIAKESQSFVVVGDSTLYLFLKNNLKPRLAIFDLLSERRKNPKRITDLIKRHCKPLKKIRNKAGTISKQAICEILKFFKTKSSPNRFILVDGEEDLLALPAIKYAPLGTHVFYGQPKKGIVAVPADKTSKKRAEQILRMLKRR
ncbi:MAG: DUF359 domain-containing protein [Candidatus Anstonellales archaeon]